MKLTHEKREALRDAASLLDCEDWREIAGALLEILAEWEAEQESEKPE